MHRETLSRRTLLSRTGAGFGALAAGSLLQAESQHESSSSDAKAKSVIWLFMNGGPSGIDLFDYKPALEKWDGKPFPEKISTLFPHPGPIMRPAFPFARYGECGAMVAKPYSQLAKHVDKMTFLKACYSTELNHGPACYLMNSGSNQIGSPALGSWLTYGLGSLNQNLPAFVVMYDSCCAPEGGANLWGSGFLPASTQAVPLQPDGEPVLYLNRPDGLGRKTQLAQRDLLRTLNERHRRRVAVDQVTQDALESRIASFETAFQMQTEVPRVVDLAQETDETRRLYGVDSQECDELARKLLLARRMVEEGVRCIQIYHGGSTNNWDDHGGLAESHSELCTKSDRPIAGLLEDLQRRGLLDSTLVVWGGEFGRLPISQDVDGRDHNPYGFAMWLAGGGVRRGFSYGELDEFGYRPVQDAVSMHDLHATILHLMGIDHEELGFFFAGRKQTLTNSLGDVVHEIIA